MKKMFTFQLCLLMSFGLTAQKKQLSEKEAQEQSVQITDPVLQVAAWEAGYVHLTAVNAREKKSRTVVVDLAKGKIVRDELAPAEEGTARQREASPPLKMPDNAVNPVFSPDSAYVAFTRSNDLYTVRVADGKETRLTFDGSDVILNGYASWVYMEEILGRRSRYRAFWWSPNSRNLAFFRTDDSEVPTFTVTDSPGKHGYVEVVRYPKAGDRLPQVKVGVVAASGGAVTWSEPFPSGKELPAADSSRKNADYWGLPYWRPDSKALWLQWLNHAQNTLKILEMNITSGALKELYHEHQSTWISLDKEPRIHFLQSGKGFILESDRSGWNHLYLHDMNGKLLRPLTSGSYAVLSLLGVDEKAQTLYFTCRKDHVGREDFYSAGLNGKNLKRLSFGRYTHRISLSDNKKYFVTTYSNVATPSKVALYSTKGKLVCEIQNTENKNFGLYERPQTDFVTLKSDDGLFNLPMRITWPLKREPQKAYPVKVSVYGGPGMLIVRDGWADNFADDAYRLAQDGVIQVAMDHRGSGHNGKTGENQLHRRLGHWEVKDYAQCVRWLVENGQADPERVLITGYSYGGYITCYALACGAGAFTHGIAGGSVTDWELYDAAYTERYMDTPRENPEGYKSASVLAHANSMQGKLLLTHGLCDENVHAQNTFQLVSRLEDLHKPFQLMIYPESRHGYTGKKREYSAKTEQEITYQWLGIKR